MKIIAVSEPLVGKKELEYVTEAIRSGWISSEGKYLKSFENKFSSYVHRKHGITVNNGTNALILALRALDFPKGSEVIIPSFTIISCALACICNNLTPIFIDSESETWNMDINKIPQKLNKKTKAIMAVHIYGHPVDMNKINNLAKNNNLVIVEDFAEAIGSEYRGKKCGGFGKISCVSFYANKIVSTGEGGMCLTDDEGLSRSLRSLKNLGFIPEKRFVHNELGFNFRMTNIQAALGLAQLEKIEERVKKKIWIAKAYKKYLGDLESKGLVQLPIEKTWAKSTFWMFGVVLDRSLRLDTSRVMKKLADKGVQTRPFFYPMHLQPAFQKFHWYKKESLPVSENLYKNGFYLPSGLNLTEIQIDRIAESLREVIS